MAIVIKPKVLVSWIPTGKILLTPLIFLTLNPAPFQEKNSADTLLKIVDEQSATSDTLRKVGQSEKLSADTKRFIVKTEKVIADTSRKVGLTKITADLSRNVKGIVKNNFDTCIKLGVDEKISADTFLKTGRQEKFLADTLLKITATEKFSADLLRALRDIVKADLCRKVARAEKTLARTNIRIPYNWNYFVQSPRRLTKKNNPGLLNQEPTSLHNTFKNYGVTAINITLSERTLSDTFDVELADETIAVGDTVSIYLLDYSFDFQVEEVTYKDLVRSVKGKYCVDEQLYTWFKMPYGDDGDDETEDEYPTAHEVIQEIAHDLGLQAEINFDDFTPDNLQRGEFVTYSDVINSLFGWTSRVPNRQINVFIRGRTLYALQRGHEGKDFNITDLPHSRPTVNQKFNRVLCHNPNNDSNDDSDDKPEKFSGTITYSNQGVPPYQNKVFVSLSYQKGLLTNERISMQTGLYADNGNIMTHGQISNTHYSYQTWSPVTSDEKNNDEPQSYIATKKISSTSWEQNMTTLEKTEQIISDSTHYGYEVTQRGDELYLFHESSTVQTTEKLNGVTMEETAFKDTYHFPVGNGFYAQVAFQNGIIQGANISQGTPSNRVSPYTVDQIQGNFSSSSIVAKEPDNFDDQLSAIIDDSFPIKEKTFKESLNLDLRALHGKTVETGTVDLISKIEDGIPEINHIVDFTETVTLDGKKYFLVSNKISFTSRKLIQKLQMIRWF